MYCLFKVSMVDKTTMIQSEEERASVALSSLLRDYVFVSLEMHA